MAPVASFVATVLAAAAVVDAAATPVIKGGGHHMAPQLYEEYRSSIGAVGTVKRGLSNLWSRYYGDERGLVCLIFLSCGLGAQVHRRSGHSERGTKLACSHGQHRTVSSSLHPGPPRNPSGEARQQATARLVQLWLCDRVISAATPPRQGLHRQLSEPMAVHDDVSAIGLQLGWYRIRGRGMSS
jgi:hypothetical protein